jgi:hypothetical protein
MKKRIQLLLGLVVIFSLLTVSNTVQATPPKNAAGVWSYQSTYGSPKVAGCNLFVDTSEDGVWTGTFNGTSTESGRIALHCSGAVSFHAIVSFEGTVDGKYGTFKMSVVGSKPDQSSDWTGKYVILSGTGELAGLKSQGIWYGPGPSGIDYKGNYHFEPDN